MRRSRSDPAAPPSDLVAGDYNDKRDLFVVTLGGVDSEPDGMDDDWEIYE